MTGGVQRRGPYVVVAFSIAMLVIALLIPPTAYTERQIAVLFGLWGFSYAVVGGLLAARRPENAVGWLMLGIGVLMSAGILLGQYAGYALLRDPSLPLGVEAAWVTTWIYDPALCGITVVFLLFPEGRTVGVVRTWTLRVSVAAGLLVTVSQAVLPGPMDGFGNRTNPFGLSAHAGVVHLVLGCAGVVLACTFLVALASIVLRSRVTSGNERQQLKWVTYAMVLLVLAMALNLLPLGFDTSWVGLLAVVAGLLCLPVSIAVAILRYRLYDIDLVISRSLVFGALATFITAVYVAVVVGVGRLFGSGDRPNLALSVAATAIVAVAFEPVRDRLQKIANRVVYGERATPYEVLSNFADRMGGTYDATRLLPLMARTVGQGVEASQVQVWLQRADGLDLAATWAPDSQMKLGHRLVPSVDDVAGDRVVSVTDQGEVLGAVAVDKPASKDLTPVEDGLLQTLAAQAGPVLRNVRLIDDLRSSRQRLVATQDDERRRLERNLHDGAQQSLVAVALMLRLVQSKVVAQQQEASASLEQAADELAHAIEELRDLARGIYPVVLTERGLGSALSSLTERLPIPVTVDDRLDARVEPAVERAMYFIAFEALNSSSQAGATEAVVQLQQAGGVLTIRVDDDGGSPRDPRRGLALQRLLDRAAVVDATLTVEAAEAGGLRLVCTVPVPDLPTDLPHDETGVSAVPMGAGQ